MQLAGEKGIVESNGRIYPVQGDFLFHGCFEQTDNLLGAGFYGRNNGMGHGKYSYCNSCLIISAASLANRIIFSESCSCIEPAPQQGVIQTEDKKQLEGNIFGFQGMDAIPEAFYHRGGRFFPDTI